MKPAPPMTSTPPARSSARRRRRACVSPQSTVGDRASATAHRPQSCRRRRPRCERAAHRRRPRRRRSTPRRRAPAPTTRARQHDRAGDRRAGSDRRAPARRRCRRRVAVGRSARRRRPAPPPVGPRRPLTRSRFACEVQLGPPGVDPVVVGRHRVEAPAGGHARERLALDRHPAARRDALEHARLEHVGAGVDEVARRCRPAAASRRTRTTRPLASTSTTPNADGSSTGMRWIVASALRRPVDGDEFGDVEVGEHVAVGDDERARRCRRARRRTGSPPPCPAARARWRSRARRRRSARRGTPRRTARAGSRAPA